MKNQFSIYNFYYKMGNMVWIYNNKSKKLIAVKIDEFMDINRGIVTALPDDIYKRLKKNEMIYLGENEGEQFISDFHAQMCEPKLNIMIMASTACNFKCIYCYENFTPQNIDYKFSEVFLMGLKKQIKNYSSVFLDWFGGEPLLAKEQVIHISRESRRICRNNRKPFLGSITTNGYFLDYDTFIQLVDGNIIYFQITIDGVKHYHDRYRPLKNGDGTYDIIFNNLLEIKNKVCSSKIFRLTIRNNVNEENFCECEEFREIFERTFGDDDRFRLFLFPIKDWGGQSIKNIKNSLLNQKTLPIAEVKNSRNDLLESVSGGVCLASMKNGYVIAPDYNIYKCSHYIQGRKDLKYDNKVGVMTENGIFNICDELNEQWIYTKVENVCKNCKFLPNCILKCPLAKIKPSCDCKTEAKQLLNDKLGKYIQNHEL